MNIKASDIEELYSMEEIADLINSIVDTLGVAPSNVKNSDWFFDSIKREFHHIKSDSVKYHKYRLALQEFFKGEPL